MTGWDQRLRFYQEATWWIANEARCHYGQDRPIPYSLVAAHKEVTIDCSGMGIAICKVAGMKDPSGPSYNYNGQGWTGSLYAGGTPCKLADLRIGDYIIWKEPGGDTEHVGWVIEPDDHNPELFSHGQEAGPLRISFQAENSYHHKLGRVFVPMKNNGILAPAKPEKPKWLIVAGDGTVLGHNVRRPVFWHTVHWKVFWTRGIVKFIRQ